MHAADSALPVAGQRAALTAQRHGLGRLGAGQRGVHQHRGKETHGRRGVYSRSRRSRSRARMPQPTNARSGRFAVRPATDACQCGMGTPATGRQLRPSRSDRRVPWQPRLGRARSTILSGRRTVSRVPARCDRIGRRRPRRGWLLSVHAPHGTSRGRVRAAAADPHAVTAHGLRA